MERVLDLAFLIFFIIGLLIYGLTVQEAQTDSNLYPTTMTVISIDYNKDIVSLEDFNGNIWKFNGAEDWSINDICACIMDDKGTDSIYDDEIVETKYCG